MFIQRWIFQKQNDGRYRYHTTSGSYVWYRSSLDSGKYKVSNYAFFKPGSSYKLGAIKVKLYAAFDCGIGNNSSNGNSTNSAISPSINLGGTLSVGSSTSKFNVKTTESSVSVTSSNTNVLQVIKSGNNTPSGNKWALKAKKTGTATITITAGKKKETYKYTVYDTLTPSINLGGTISVGTTTKQFKVTTKGTSVSVTSSNTSVLQVIKYGNNTPGGNSWH